MSKSNSHARTQNGQRPWIGQDNLELPVGQFLTLCKWLDVDECHHPVKDYIASLKNLLWDIKPGTADLKDYNNVKQLVNELMLLDSNIDRIMEKGGLK